MNRSNFDLDTLLMALAGTVGFAAVPWLLMALFDEHPLRAVGCVFAALVIFAGAIVLMFIVAGVAERYAIATRLWPITVIFALAPIWGAQELIATHPDLRYALVVIGVFEY